MGAGEAPGRADRIIGEFRRLVGGVPALDDLVEALGEALSRRPVLLVNGASLPRRSNTKSRAYAGTCTPEKTAKSVILA